MAVLRLMTLNLRVSSADDGPNAWPLRWPYLKALLNTLRPDIFAAQECMPDQLVNITGDLAGYFAYPGPDTMLADGRSLRNPFFVCQPCILPRAEGALALNETGVIGQLSWDGREPRLAHLLHFQTWTLVNAHFDAWNCERARLESARLLVEMLRDRPAAVVVGDLNCTPDSAPIEVFRQAGYSSAADALPPWIDRRTFHDFTGKGIAELDYILLRGVNLLEVQIPRPRARPPFLSDHDPLVADIEVLD